MSDLLRSFRTKEQCERITLIAHDKRATWVICSWFEPIALKKEQFARRIKKKRIFCMFLTVFSFLCPRTNHSRHSSLSSSFFKEWHGIFDHVALYKRATVRESLRSLITNERPWAICSRCSFAHKKRVIRSKNRWANSQPWVMGTQVCLSSLTVRVRESDSAHYTGGKRQYGLKG